MQAVGVSNHSQGSTSSVEGRNTSLHDEMQASGQNGSTNGGSSSVGSASTPVHEEIETSSYGGSTSEGSFSIEISYPIPTREPSASMPTGVDQAQVVRENVKESIGKVKERIDHSQTVHKTKRSYQIGRNTGRDLQNLG
ncbi:hypothetical protein SB717_28120 [Priestia sp. SIMBA_032]|uniref:hypothetical protein n=1 Tax=Priestia sp. SIMBA_032 TaxID=3085775 RepID=UPI00397D1B1E